MKFHVLPRFLVGDVGVFASALLFKRIEICTLVYWRGMHLVCLPMVLEGTDDFEISGVGGVGLMDVGCVSEVRDEHALGVCLRTNTIP